MQEVLTERVRLLYTCYRNCKDLRGSNLIIDLENKKNIKFNHE